jgi:hypothetical protein
VIARGAARTLLLAALVTACLAAQDGPIPPGYRDLVESARTSLLDNFEGLVLPSLAVVRIRCFANGGVVILFRQLGGPTPGELAFAMAGQGAVEGAWSGGFGDMDAIDQEVEFNFGLVAEVVCPARAT